MSDTLHVAVSGGVLYTLCGDPDCPSCSDLVATEELLEVPLTVLTETIGYVPDDGKSVDLTIEQVAALRAGAVSRTPEKS